MTQSSYYWGGTTIGDAVLAPYDDDEFSDNWSLLFTYDRTIQGVIGTAHPSYSGQLSCTNPAGTTIRISNGAALVDGKLYKNDADVDFSINAPGVGVNYYTIVLQKVWAAQTVRLALLGPNASAYPSVTQNDGVLWEIRLWGVQINAASEITIEDFRKCISPIMLKTSGTAVVASMDGNTRGYYANDFQRIRGSVDDVASGDYATISGGRKNKASGKFSVVGGGNVNVASGTPSSVLGGQNNTASGNFSVVGGGNINVASGTNSSILGGQNNAAFGNFSVVGGGNINVASGTNSSILGGQNNAASGIYSTITGGYKNTASTAYSFVGGGNENTVSGANAAVVGGKNNTASGTGASIIGGENNIATGTRAIAGGNANEARGDHSFAVGSGCVASAAGTIAAGVSCNATSPGDIAVGYGSTASGGGSVAVGFYATATKPMSIALGNQARADKYGQIAFGNADYQMSWLMLRGFFTHSTNAWYDLKIGSGGGDSLLTIPNNTMWGYEVMVINSAGNAFTLVGAIRNAAGTTTLLSSTPGGTAVTPAGNYSVRATADDVNDALVIQVRDSSASGATVMWAARVALMEL